MAGEKGWNKRGVPKGVYQKGRTKKGVPKWVIPKGGGAYNQNYQEPNRKSLRKNFKKALPSVRTYRCSLFLSSVSFVNIRQKLIFSKIIPLAIADESNIADGHSNYLRIKRTAEKLNIIAEPKLIFIIIDDSPIVEYLYKLFIRSPLIFILLSWGSLFDRFMSSNIFWRSRTARENVRPRARGKTRGIYSRNYAPNKYWTN